MRQTTRINTLTAAALYLLLDQGVHLCGFFVNFRIIRIAAMQNRICVYILSGICILLSGSCRRDETRISNSLDRMNWSERNFSVINQLIDDYGTGGQFYDEKNTPYVVLDWDQTCAHFDVEEAVMRYQLSHLRFKLTKEQFSALLKDSINGVTQLSGSFNDLQLSDIHLDLKDDYNYLYDNYIGANGSMSFDQIKQTPQFKDFLAKIPFLYDGYCATAGIGEEYGYPWILYLFAGMTEAEVKEMATEAISFELGNQLSKQTWVSPAGFPTRSGVVAYSYKSGLRVFPEMQNLISTFKRSGIEVFIVSASFKPVVEVFSGIGNFGYNVPAEHVIAMELETESNGKIMPEYKSGWVKTFRQGKVEAINQV
ncbi:MAG: hypothetical protein HGA37_08735, partial [Lentimicrobium sp.]|nr:hypothetical protein [Lentimicrobium sp.]